MRRIVAALRAATALSATMLALAACVGPLAPEGSELERNRVLPPVAFEMLHDNRYLPILDLRRPEEFNGPLGHLARSRNLPLEQLDWRLSELAELKKRTILIYCRGDGDPCGLRGLKVLVENGFTAVLMEGGISEWIESGFGTVGARPATETSEVRPGGPVAGEAAAGAEEDGQ